MRVRLTEDAASDLRGIKAHFANRTVVIGERILKLIGNTVSHLSMFPRLGHPGIVDGTLERTVPRSPHVIVYRLDIGDDDQLTVLRIYHTAQDRSRGEY